MEETQQIHTDLTSLNEKIKQESAFLDILKTELRKVVIGQEDMVNGLLIGLLGDGHILLEGIPGLAKTLAIKSLADCISADFSRIQFTPDLLPGDVLGTQIYNPAKSEFSIKKGPVFANFVLADEINRAPAKVQSALLEAMQERQVTIGEETFILPKPFLVLATQNPIEQEGTYPLPEAQVDRFMLKVLITYPEMEHEREILRLNMHQVFPTINKVIKPQDILKAREAVREVYMDEKIEQYILDLVRATRDTKAFGLDEISTYIEFGASPRATIFMAKAAKAFAFMNHRGFVVPEDVRTIATSVLRHRIGLTYLAEAENISSDQIISSIIGKVEVP